MPHNHRGQRLARRKAWIKMLIQTHRALGDKRPAQAILDEYDTLREIQSRMFHEAYRDKERAEVVAMENYEPLTISRGEVLSQGRFRYVHPVLTAPLPPRRTKGKADVLVC